MLLIAYEKACEAIFSLLKLEELSGEVDASSAVFFLVLGAPASLFEEVLVGGVPVSDAVAKDDAGTVKKPRGFFFAFEVGVGSIDVWIFFGLFAIESFSPFFLLPCLGVPYIASTPHPLA